jgi:hypothetical protein
VSLLTKLVQQSVQYFVGFPAECTNLHPALLCFAY